MSQLASSQVSLRAGNQGTRPCTLHVADEQVWQLSSSQLSLHALQTLGKLGWRWIGQLHNL